jgi:hypothetical protein
MSGKVSDKTGTPIEVGDTVYTKIRGGKREGEVFVFFSSLSLSLSLSSILKS